MAKQSTLRTPLRWTGGHHREPVWPREPAITAVRSLAKHHLQPEVSTAIEDTLLDVSFFAEGAFNKLYRVSYPEHHPSYLLRVTLPVEPYFKTESEVATLAYLRANTSIPAPRVIAWQSNLDSELGFEWILMEVIDGVPLYDVWRKIPWDRKLVLVEVLAGLIKELQDHKFNSIGALYFKSALMCREEEQTDGTEREPSTEDVVAEEKSDALVEGRNNGNSEASVSTPLEDLKLDASSPGETANLEPDPETFSNGPRGKHTLAKNLGRDDFAIGPLLDSLFFAESRPHLPGNRGPYRNPIEWLSGLIHVQLEWIKKGPVEDDDDYGSSFEEEAPVMTSLCHEYLNILPAIFANEVDSASYVLHHSDLNAANILVNGETFDVTGIVDWELINVVPYWKAMDYPVFMQDTEPFDEVEPPIPSYEDEQDISVYTRDRWDNRLLRRHWNDTMKRLREGATADTDALEDAKEIEVKRGCLENIPNLTDTWNWARLWLKKYRTGSDDSDEEEGSDAGKESDGKKGSDAGEEVQ